MFLHTFGGSMAEIKVHISPLGTSPVLADGLFYACNPNCLFFVSIIPVLVRIPFRVDFRLA